MNTKTIHQNLLRLAVTLAVVMMTTTSALAKTWFITNVMLLGGKDNDALETQKRVLRTEGWTAIDQNLNAGAGGDYIYLLYKEAPNTDANATFITDFYIDTTVKQSENTPDSRTVNNRTYYLVPTTGSDDFKKFKGNLNNGIKGGDQIHLYYTKASFGDHNAVMFIDFNNTQSGALGKNGETTGYDLNSPKKGDKIYMHVDKSKGWIINKGGDKCTITGYEGLTLEYTSIEIPTKIDGATVINFSSDFSFSEFENLEEMTFPMESVLDAMPSVQGCTKLKNVIGYVNGTGGVGSRMRNYTLPRTIINIPAYTFACTAIEELTLPGVTFIGMGAFEGCNSLNFIRFGNSAEIRSRAFANSSSSGIVSYNGPLSNWTTDIYQYSPNLTFLAEDTSFGWCGGSKEADNNELYWMLKNTETIGYRTYNHLTIACANNKWQTAPNEQVIKTSNWKKKISHSNSIKSLTTEHVYAIGASEFKNFTDLESVELKDGITSIGASAFEGCSKLTSATIAGNPAIGSNAFPSGTTLTLNLSANDADGAKWMTFYNNYANFQADENTTVYKATVIGQSLVLTEVADRIVDAGTAVILKSTGNPVMTRVTGRSSDTQDNALLGTMEATATPANCFTLASGPQGVGFYRYTGDEVAAGKAYLIYNGASAAREFIGFDETTGIRPPLTPAVLDGNGCAWYDLYGRKLQGEPAKKGIYVRNGYTVIIK